MTIASSLQRIVAVLGLLLLGTTAFGQPPVAVYSPINAKMRQRDARLDAPVSFSANRIYLGELLEALSAKTGVTLSMDNNDSFSGILISCDLKQMPLAEVMNSLWSLVGSRNGLWEWKPDTRQTPIRYSFRPTPDARKLTERLHQAMQERFEAQAELLVRIAFLSPEERKTHADDLVPFMGAEDLETAHEAAEAFLTREEFWAGIRLFANFLSADQRTQVLRGEIIDIPLNSLAQEDRQFALSTQSQLKMNYISGEEGEGWDAIRFERTPDDPGNRSRDYLEVMVGFARRNSSVLQSCFGVGANGMFPRLFADWLLPGDVRTRDIETRPMGSMRNFKQDEIWKNAPLVDRNLALIAATEEASFMAVVPDGASDISVLPPSSTPAEYFHELWHWKMLMHKWRAGVLLLHYPQWFYGDEGQCPYGTIKRLRTMLQKQDGFFSLADIAELLSTLTLRQLTRLTEEFPLLEGYRIMTMGQYPQPVTALCAFYQRYPKCLSEHGVPLDLKMQTCLHDLNLWPVGLKEEERVKAVRILEVSDPSATDARHTYTLQFTTSRQPWNGFASFWTGRIERKPPSSLRDPVVTEKDIETERDKEVP